MTRRVRPLLAPAAIVGALVVLATTLLVGRAAADDTPEPGRVLIIAAPRLTWATLDEIRPPHLMDLLGRAAVALCSTRTAGSVTRPGDAYLTLGAGNRMGTVVNVDGSVVDRNEPTVEGDPSAVFQRTTGITPTRPILAMGKPTIDSFNEDEQFFGAEAGALAEALEGADRSMSVIANADQAFGVPMFRQAGLAAMDEDGEVGGGMVSSELLRADDRAAFGLSTDPEVFASVFATSWERDDVVLVELSDLERAEMARKAATPEQGDRQYRRALLAGDDLVGKMVEQVDPARDTVVFVSPTPPEGDAQLTVFAMYGRGATPGWATSSTTRRDGYVTLTDVAPWVLGRFGVDVPASMNDTPLSTRGADESLATKVAWMTDRAERAVVRDQAFGPTTVVFIVAIVVDIALAVLCLARFPRLAGLVRGLALAVLAIPPVTYLLGIVSIGSAAVLGLAVGVGAIVLAAVAAGVSRALPWKRRGAAPVVLLGVLWLVLAVDIATGGQLQINTIFGYSPIVAGRFAGFGNQAFSMIALAALLLAATLVEWRTPPGARASRTTLLVAAVWFLVTVVLDGHPSMGSDVGGVLAFVPAATIALLMFAGTRIRVRVAAAIAGGTVAVLALFAGVDLGRPADERTHLGRFVAKLFDGDAGEIIQRKIAANLRVLTSVWAWVIPVALVYFMYLTWRPNHTLQQLNRRHPQFRAFGVAALTLGVLAMALNDSGVSLPAMMVALVAAYVSYHVVELDGAAVQAGDAGT